MDELFDDKHAEKMYSPKCSVGDIVKMVELPGSRTATRLNGVESVVKRSWSANRLNNSKPAFGNTAGEKSAHQYKFTTLTDSSKVINKPPRIYSANVKRVTVRHYILI